MLTQSPTSRARLRRWFWAAMDMLMWVVAVFATAYLRYDVLNGQVAPASLFGITLTLALDVPCASSP